MISSYDFQVSTDRFYEIDHAQAMTEPRHILSLGIGNVLLADEGMGVRVIERLEERYKHTLCIFLIGAGTGDQQTDAFPFH